MDQPNVLIILADQQRFDTVHAAGYEHMITPNLDRLAQEGCLFSCAHSGNPVCMPARHDLITGFPARIHGYYANRDIPIQDYSVPTLPRIFSRHGYRTVAVGKMHFSPPREHHGFDQMILMEELPRFRQEDEYATYLKSQGMGKIQNIHGVRPHIYHIPQTSQQPEIHHGTTWVADRAIEWLHENQNHPFMMMCGFIQPHPPWNIPRECQSWYENIEVPHPIKKSRLPFEDEEKSNWFGDNDSWDQMEKIRKAYYTAVTMVDKNVGRIIEYLRENGKLDNTLVIYASDHGEMLQDKGYYSKELPYDSSVRVPMIVRYPKLFSAGSVRNDFVDLLDIMPTCLDICGIDYPDQTRSLFGSSLTQKRERMFQCAATGLFPLRWVMCRNQTHKYIYHYMGGYEELYDMKDPETDNLIQHGVPESLRCVYQQLKEQAIAYESKWGIEDGVKDGEFISVPVQTVHPDIRSKFHMWSNMQMQYFYEADQYPRGERLEEEMAFALSNYDWSGVELSEVFCDEEWLEQLGEEYSKYTNGEKFDGFGKKLDGK